MKPDIFQIFAESDFRKPVSLLPDDNDNVVKCSERNQVTLLNEVRRRVRGRIESEGEGETNEMNERGRV